MVVMYRLEVDLQLLSKKTRSATKNLESNKG